LTFPLNFRTIKVFLYEISLKIRFMAKVEERRKALELRKQGKSYSQIKKELALSKSTLSVWLRNYPLSKEQIRVLRDWSEVRIEKFRRTMQRKREKRLASYRAEERKKWLPLSPRELFLAGLFLYWGEGNKSLGGGISLSNSDPNVIKFFIYWLVKCLRLDFKKIKVYVHLYSDMNINEELGYWSKELRIPLGQFSRPYIKKNERADIDQKGFGHGTCNLFISDVRTKERMMMGIRAIYENYSLVT
jgi:hypothetical protein